MLVGIVESSPLIPVVVCYLNNGLHMPLDELVLQHTNDPRLRALIEVVARSLRLLGDASLHAVYVHCRAILCQELLRFHLNKQYEKISIAYWFKVL